MSVGTMRYLFTLKFFTLVYIRSPRLSWPDCAEKDCVVNWLKNAKLSEAARCLLNVCWLMMPAILFPEAPVVTLSPRHGKLN